MPSRKCAKKILGDAMKISQATPEQLRKIEKCIILSSGGKPNPEVFGEPKKKKSEEKLKKLEEKSPVSMGSPLYGKISSACKAAAKKKFKVWPSAYASGWGVRCTKAGGPSNFGGKKKK